MAGIRSADKEKIAKLEKTVFQQRQQIRGLEAAVLNVHHVFVERASKASSVLIGGLKDLQACALATLSDLEDAPARESFSGYLDVLTVLIERMDGAADGFKAGAQAHIRAPSGLVH